MSLEKIGKRTPSDYERTTYVEGETFGIPGAEKPHLFYQDLKRLPTADYGKGIYIYDTEGNRYLDGCSGAISANLGHGNERVISAAVDQLNKIAFTYRQQFENKPANDLAELLVKLSPPELNRVFFVNSGSEAVEAAMKLARQYWWTVGQRGKSQIIATRPSYHGATLGALSTTDYSPLNKPFRAMTVHSPKVSAPFCYHCPLEKEYPGCGIACALELEKKLQVYGSENIAAFIVEPIGGSTTGGAVPPDEYFPLIERICNEHNILLIIDDVMMGCGRTGTFFGFEHWDITPDIVATSKGLSSGYTPMGAIIASDAVVQPVLDSGGFMHGHTYAGNPLSAAISLAAVNEILDNELVENAAAIGTYMHERLHELKEVFPSIGDIRGRGLLAGLEFVQNRETRVPFPANWFVALELTELARKHGLLIYPRRSINGLWGDHVLIAPPMIIDEQGIDEMIDLLQLALNDLQDLLVKHIHDVNDQFKDQTVQRYEQPEEVPAYARGDVSSAKSVRNANVTAAMETGHFNPQDYEEEIEEE
ncbi:MAG: aminotransferase class III-fold pyridoxal phosphate-dependent enzyme [Planctomycetota bacterium]